MQKALLPGLWSLLNAGGYGSARIAYKFLLPLLSKLVDQVQLIDQVVAVTRTGVTAGAGPTGIVHIRAHDHTVSTEYVLCVTATALQ